VRILHTSIGVPPPPFTDEGGAVQRRVAELAREQVRRGHDVTVLCPGGDNSSAEIDGVHVRYLHCRCPPPWAHLEFQARCIPAVVRRRRGLDLLHVHNEPEAGLASLPLRIPTVLSYDNFNVRGSRVSRLHPLYRRSLSSFDALLACSNYARDLSLEHWKVPGEIVHVLPNGVSLAQFSPNPESARAERAAFSGPVVLYLGRVCRQKGVHTLLDAARRLPGLGIHADVVIAGPIGEFEARDQTAETREWEARIAAAGAHYLGRVPEERLAGLLTMADVFVMPTVELEMQGMAALEAQACGTPVVASDHGGLKETVPDTAGIRFTPGDDRELAEAVATMLTDSDARQAYSRAALEHARGLSWGRIVDRLSSIYEGARQAA
jgi:glycosyltransferase involved in cell wall biosynthesis